MRDFLSFTLRGAWAGAAFVLALMILHYGARGALFLLSPLVLVYAGPGTLVGIVLWVIAGKTLKPLSPGIRFAIGGGVAAAILLLTSFYQVATNMNRTDLNYVDMPSLLMRIGVYAAGIGGLAGVACPSSRDHANPRSHLTYSERVQLYEAAEQEMKEARRKLASSNGIRNRS